MIVLTAEIQNGQKLLKRGTFSHPRIFNLQKHLSKIYESRITSTNCAKFLIEHFGSHC